MLVYSWLMTVTDWMPALVGDCLVAFPAYWVSSHKDLHIYGECFQADDVSRWDCKSWFSKINSDDDMPAFPIMICALIHIGIIESTGWFRSNYYMIKVKWDVEVCSAWATFHFHTFRLLFRIPDYIDMMSVVWRKIRIDQYPIRIWAASAWTVLD